MPIDLNAFEKGLDAYCENANKQMNVWSKEMSGRQPEIVLPFILNPRSALQAAIEVYEFSKAEQFVSKEVSSVNLEAGALAISKTLDRPDNWGSTPFVELSKACAEAWGLKWK